MEEWDPVVVKMLSIFMPTAFEGRASIKRHSRFVHYTTAANLFRILDRQQVWFRNARCMNDDGDTEYAAAKVQEWLNDSGRTAQLAQTLEFCMPGIWQDGVKKFELWLPRLRNETYVLSVAEHDLEEHSTGRLSLWRAFDDEEVAVAAVVNVAPFIQMTDALQAYPGPVTYWTNKQFDDEFKLVAHRVASNRDFLAKLSKGALTEVVFLMLLFAVTCWKHPGLRDEREWRVLTNPLLWPSKRLFKTHEVIDRIPQPVYALPLKNDPGNHLTGIELPELIDRIIIGPTDQAGPIRDAIIAKLAEIGVNDPDSKVVASGLPLRTSKMG